MSYNRPALPTRTHSRPRALQCALSRVLRHVTVSPKVPVQALCASARPGWSIEPVFKSP